MAADAKTASLSCVHLSPSMVLFLLPLAAFVAYLAYYYSKK